ncbi:hypothetical protein AN958_08517 [Leucoagaricus sp. SymC.cos]|nr:hypothetical protein AN958_08517 [Leucoagaricus sp. SymC.cos]
MADAVTISLLPVPLALVHIPRTRLPSLSHPILRHILHPSPTFFTVTANEIEISLFVDYEHVQDFDVIARKDRCIMRKDSVEISYEPWSVLQIDSHSDQQDNSGARVNELSAPLAAAGISILYQSSYMCDFIFVKQSRLHEALTLFETAGFDLYTSDTSSPIPPSYQPSNSPFSSTIASSPTVLTLGQSSTLVSQSSSTPTSCSITPNGRSSVIHQLNERTKAQSPTSGEVRILTPDLACVGLSDELGVDHWGLKIVKLVAFPELIPSSWTKKRRRQKSSSSSGDFYDSASSCLSFDGGEEDDGYFSHSPHSISTSDLAPAGGPSRSRSSSMNTPSQPRSALGQNLPPINTDLLLNHTTSPTTSPSLPSSSTSSHFALTSAPSTLPTSEYGVESPHRDRPHSSMISPTSASTSSSLPPSPPPSLQVPFFSFTRTQEGSSLTADVKTLAALFLPEERHLLVCCNSLEFGGGSGDANGGWNMDEGVFDDDDDEETVADGLVNVMDDLHLSRRGGTTGGYGNSTGGEEEDGGVDDMSIGELKCLQIDLRRFGLDKYGLVNKFSRVLGENGINHMYSSTFKTANLLVNKRHAMRAQALLRGC